MDHDVIYWEVLVVKLGDTKSEIIKHILFLELFISRCLVMQNDPSCNKMM